MKLHSKVLTAVCLSALLAGCAETKTSESTGQFLDNTAITTKVKAALVNDEGVRSLPITVKSYKGQVQLSGFVDTQAQKVRAAHDASKVEGVDSVKNDLIVR